jgi:rare lipoprotein A
MPHSERSVAAARPSPAHCRRARVAALAAIAALLVAGCATRAPERDGPDARPPPGLDRVPDAEPRIEPVRSGGPNKPYEVLGRRYVPLAGDPAVNEEGLASWYGRKFHGRPTASGEPYDMYAMTAAHKTMPLPSYARVRNPANGREVIVRVNDRGPFADGRVIDLSYTAALKLGVLRGVAPVEVRRITHAEIRDGRWRREAPADGAGPLTIDDPTPNEAAPGAGFWLQLGAFRQPDGAAELRDRVLREAEDLVPMVVLRPGDGVTRVHAGPFATRAEAQVVAERLRGRFGTLPLIVERR